LAACAIRCKALALLQPRSVASTRPAWAFLPRPAPGFGVCVVHAARRDVRRGEQIRRETGAAKHAWQLCTERVRYHPRGGALLNWMFVRRDVEKIFQYRHQRLDETFPVK
jgi:hypothetical protein